LKNIFTERKRFHLFEEMLETPGIIAKFDESIIGPVYDLLKNYKKIMLTGEGSSVLFPARNMVFNSLRLGTSPTFITQSSNDLYGLNLSEFAIIGASNSGKTKEIVSLFRYLMENNHKQLISTSSNPNSILGPYSHFSCVIPSGKELAVASTKAVVGQALFYDLLLSCWTGRKPDLKVLSQNFEQSLLENFDPWTADLINQAENLYFAGINNGVAEELALKTPEVIRKKSGFFPGSMLLHGVEEMVTDKDVVVLVDYLPQHESKIHENYTRKIGTRIICFSETDTRFHTIRFNSGDSFYTPYIKLAMGWKLLAEAGDAAGIDLDKPLRAKKVGNEYFDHNLV